MRPCSVHRRLATIGASHRARRKESQWSDAPDATGATPGGSSAMFSSCQDKYVLCSILIYLMQRILALAGRHAWHTAGAPQRCAACMRCNYRLQLNQLKKNENVNDAPIARARLGRSVMLGTRLAEQGVPLLREQICRGLAKRIACRCAIPTSYMSFSTPSSR